MKVKVRLEAPVSGSVDSDSAEKNVRVGTNEAKL
jgi:hypothetical protein